MSEPQSPGMVERWSLRLSTLRELLQMLSRHKRYWMIPMVVVFGLLGLVLSGLQAIEYVAPFIYAVF